MTKISLPQINYNPQISYMGMHIGSKCFAKACGDRKNTLHVFTKIYLQRLIKYYSSYKQIKGSINIFQKLEEDKSEQGVTEERREECPLGILSSDEQLGPTE